jgi:hypothetical protein
MAQHWPHVESSSFLDPHLASKSHRTSFSAYLDNLEKQADPELRKMVWPTLSISLIKIWDTLNSCGIPILPSRQQQRTGKTVQQSLPSRPIQSALLDVKVLDSILDACRPVDDLLLIQQSESTNRNPTDLHRGVRPSRGPGRDESIFSLLQDRLEYSSQAHPTAVLHSPDDEVMSQLVHAQVSQVHASKKQAITARLVEFSASLRAWLLVRCPYCSPSVMIFLTDP